MINVKDFHDLSYDYWKNKLGLFGGVWTNGSSCGSLGWGVNGAVGSAGRAFGARLEGNKWKVYNGFYHDESVNIIMTENNIEFIEDSDFTEITKEEMYDFYLFLKKKLYKDIIIKADFVENAEEMRKKADDNKKMCEIKNRIKEQIENTANKGEYYCYTQIDKPFAKEMIAYLEKLNYKVIRTSGMKEVYKISW